MPIFNTKMPKYNPDNDAVRREQRRNADLDREERNKKFPTIFVKTFGFRPYYTGHDTIHIKGPLCPGLLAKDRQCLAQLSGENEQSIKSHCDVCGMTFDLPYNFEKFKEIALKAYEGLLNSQTEIITLDVPYNAVKGKAEDETRYIKVVWSQKDGRNQAIIYLIGKDDNGDKSQIFVDLDREEVRYDPGDIPPGSILAKIKAEFKGTKINIEYKKRGK